ncbi:hypothetical protein [Streptomyces afghaniensis]|uniref:hypothetical protein n=1 Tax=Streptomyces afghaniensis TaxID=66865 RepID=UPI00278B9ED3|nr:hypothetical protein [Streptomyces afghaniensis]MDQ1013994.1 short-subunit dehydrogenase [Streptomyces afghaniensis]
MGPRHHVVVVTGVSSGIGREQGTGTLINIASIVGAVARPYSHPYGMSKHAVRALGS